MLDNTGCTPGSSLGPPVSTSSRSFTARMKHCPSHLLCLQLPRISCLFTVHINLFETKKHEPGELQQQQDLPNCELTNQLCKCQFWRQQRAPKLTTHAPSAWNRSSTVTASASWSALTDSIRNAWTSGAPPEHLKSTSRQTVPFAAQWCLSCAQSTTRRKRETHPSTQASARRRCTRLPHHRDCRHRRDYRHRRLHHRVNRCMVHPQRVRSTRGGRRARTTPRLSYKTEDYPLSLIQEPGPT